MELEQGATTFWKSAEALGPVVVILIVIFGIVLWQLLRLFTDERDNARKTAEARVDDGAAMQTVIKENTVAITTFGNEIAAMKHEQSRLSSEIARLKP